MTATELLKKDHQKAMSLIGELEAADRQVGTVQTNTDVFNHLNELLMMHALIEEEVLYPVMKEFDESRDLARSFHKEHEEVERLLSHLSTMAPNVEEFQKTLADLRERVERHIDEEENELFPLAEELCEPRRLQEMGRRMQEMKYDGRTKAAAIRRR
ncbi:MAG: hemerythrin domain-containing protein [Blastocatellia bacterium]